MKRPHVPAWIIGPVVLAAIGALVYLGVKNSYGGFDKTYNLTMTLPRAGQQLQEGSDVRLRGTFIPAYALNNFLACFPIIGDIIGGGRNEGIFGMTYEVVGPPGNATLRVMPMSMFAPGIFRKMFEFRNADDRTSVPPSSSGGGSVPSSAVTIMPSHSLLASRTTRVRKFCDRTARFNSLSSTNSKALGVNSFEPSS